MSYARNNGVDSDVYVYSHYAGFIECCGCSLTEADEWEDVGFFKAESAFEALKHLEQHVSMGDRVPESAFVRIREEHKDLMAKIVDTEEHKTFVRNYEESLKRRPKWWERKNG